LIKGHGARRWVWGLVVFWMVLIFALSAVPNVPGKRGLPKARDWRIDNVLHEMAHVGEYVILTGLVWQAVRTTRWPGRAGLWALGWTALYGASDELHQFFVPGRTCALDDWALDVAGALLALALLAAWGAWRARGARKLAGTRGG
jgi:VanZ family protein